MTNPKILETYDSTLETGKGCRVEVYSDPDARGRCHFAIMWVSDYHPGHPDGEYVTRERGQHYFGVPRDRFKPTDKDQPMRKANWKHKLFITQDANGVHWYSNGHWAVNDSIAGNTNGLRNLINLPPGVYRNHEYCDGEKTPDIARVVKSTCGSGDLLELRDTGWIVGKAGEDHLARVLVTAREETPRMVLIDDIYAELYERSGTFQSPLWWDQDFAISIGNPKDPDGVIMCLRELEGNLRTGRSDFTLPV